MRRSSRASGSARPTTLLTVLCGALTLFACVRSSDDDVFKHERCTLGEETCGCRADKTCNGALACLSDLCVDATGNAGTTSAGGSAGSAAGSAGAANQSEAGSEDTSGSGGAAGAGSGGDGSSGGASDDENGGSGGGEPGGNLVENGDFSDAETLWTIEPAGAYRSIADGALCFTIQAGESVSLGWPSDTSRAFELSGGQSYTFSYRASSSGPLAVSATAKIGHAVSPYTSYFEEAIDIDNNLESDSHDLEVENDDEGAGVLFSLTGAQGVGATTVCFDDVSVLESP